jgi:hypothetical protein
MAASDRNTRRADEAERARHLATSEAAAFATTAGTMLLGLLTDAEAAHNRNELQPPAASRPPVPPSHPSEAAPTKQAPAEHPPTLDDRHAGAVEAPAADATPTMKADSATAFQAPDPSAHFDASPADQAGTAQTSIPSIPVWTFSAAAHPTPSPGAGAGISGTTAPPSSDLEAPVHQLADTASGLVDTALATVTHAVAGLSAAVGQLTSSLTDTVSDLVGGLTGLLANLADPAPATGAAEQPEAAILSPTPAAAESPDTTHHAASLLDTAGAVPMALLHPLPLHLGFLGQPTSDGHETHDGAFSALGVHHF